MRISDWSSDVCSSDLTEYALQMLEELSRQIVLQLQERKQGGRRFEAMFFRTDGLMRRLRIETGLPMRDAKAMIRLFRERLDSLNDPLAPGFGFDLVRLCVQRTEPFAPAQLNLEGGRVSEMDSAALIDWLSTRLGRSRLKRFQSREIG